MDETKQATVNGMTPEELATLAEFKRELKRLQYSKANGTHDTGQSAEAPVEAPYIHFAPAFLAQVDPPMEYLVNELIPAGVIALLHGEPRTRKSWAALDIAIAVATGNTRAFGLERFAVGRPLPVLYSSQEDGAALVRGRAKALLRGRGIETWPDT